MRDNAPLQERVRVNAHSSVRLELGGKVLYVDPFSLTEAHHDADLIFLTHDHFDHFSPADIALVSKADTVFVLPESIAVKAASAIGPRRSVTVNPGDRGEIEGIAFEAVPAYNPGKRFHPRANDWVGWVLEAEGLRFYVAGDTDATPEAAAVRCDAALLPIGGTYTMDAEEAAALANQIRPRLVIPIHYGSVVGTANDFARFAAGIEEGIRVVRLI